MEHGRVELRAKGPHAPHFLRCSSAQCKQGRAFAIARRDEQLSPADNRVGGVDAVFGHPGRAPRLLAVDGADREIRLRRAQQHQPTTGELDRERRGIAGVLSRRFPEDFSGGLVQREPGFADIQNQSPVEHQRSPGESPVGHRATGFLLDIHRPDNLSGGGLEAKRIAPAAQRVQPISVERGRAGGAALEKLVPQFGRVAVFPNRFSGGRLKTEHRVLPVGMPHRVNAPARHDERRGAETDLGPPGDRRSRGRPLVEPAFFGGNSVAVRPAPLGPIGRLGRRTENGQQDHTRPEAHQEERVFETHHERGDQSSNGSSSVTRKFRARPDADTPTRLQA